MFDIKNELNRAAELTEEALDRLLPSSDPDYPVIFEAVRYSAMAGGKRIRPFITLKVCEMLGGDVSAALPYAAAIEMIHCYSLIHDDLPCMDNDDLRRGKPTNHKVYGEAMALLAGDALLTHAFGAAASNEKMSPETNLAALKLLSERAGCYGMIGGQVLDMIGEETPHSYELLLKMHEKKTGALIRLSAELGALAAGCRSGEKYEAAVKYAEYIGLAFQIVDDILDAEGDEVTLGKSVGTDRREGKTTFLSFMSIYEAHRRAELVTIEAKNAIEKIENNETLLALADYLLSRKS
ncbi:MAG: polyprenyl synthetase family protein [Clostridia bacterium]|nr:polyprenyl synthetase family protein [Clostridia bacterium]